LGFKIIFKIQNVGKYLYYSAVKKARIKIKSKSGLDKDFFFSFKLLQDMDGNRFNMA